jgi:uncharacterized radical SAM superfamily Fe-S cluster-containing enzyme
MIHQLVHSLEDTGAITINLHLTGHCNMACHGCFARFGSNGS